METKQLIDVKQNPQPSLPLNTETDHFKLYCMFNDKEAAKKVLDVAEQNLKKLSEDFKHPYSTKINLYVFPSLQEHHNAIGWSSAEDWLVNAMFDETHSFFTVSPANPGPQHSAESILKLNIVGLTELFIKDAYKNVPTWFGFGIGLLNADWKSTKTLKELAQDHTKIPTFEQLNSSSQTSDAQMIRQNASYSVIEYLNKTKGWDIIRALLADFSSFEKILGVSQEVFRNQWIEYLDSTYLDKK